MKRIKPWLPVWAAMILAALGHYKDVGKAVAATGDSWLSGWYLALVFVIFLGTAVLGVVFFHWAGKQKWSLERIRDFFRNLVPGSSAAAFRSG